jgi:nucleoside-diphosphate-sugar epimerase
MVLVSGATGFLGTHLLKKLCTEKVELIRAMYRSEAKKKYTISLLQKLLKKTYHPNILNIEWVKADVLDIPSLDIAFMGIKYVYNCSGWVGDSSNNKSLMRKVNVEGVANLVNVAIHHKIEKFCHVSSIAALGMYPNSNKIDENAPRDGQQEKSMYSITKYGAELEVWRASQEGLNVVIVNPGVILGSGFFDSGSGLIFSKVLQNTSFYPPKKTGFVFIDDVTNIMLKLMQSDFKNQRYIIVGKNTNFKNIMDMIAKTFKRKGPRHKANKLLLYLVWVFQAILSIFKPIKTKISLNLIKQLNSRKIYMNDKSVKELDIEYTPMNKAIKLIFEDYKLLNNS